jgi:hypothetical protein
MGKASVLTLGQRGPDARQEVPMSTPKPLYAHERVMYHPELLTCPHGGDLLVMCNSLGWDKTVPRLDRVLSVASRAGRCPPRPRASPPWSCWLGASGRGASALASAGASTGSAPHPRSASPNTAKTSETSSLGGVDGLPNTSVRSRLRLSLASCTTHSSQNSLRIPVEGCH